MKLILVTLLLVGCAKGSETLSSVAPELPPTEDLGISVVSNRIINAYNVDMCTQFSDQTCAFMGGQRVAFNDGSTLLTGSFMFVSTLGGDTDMDQNTATIFIPSSTSSAAVKLSGVVSRGTSGLKGLYLVWTKNPETLSLVHDTNGSTVIDIGDEIITTLTLSSW